MWRISSNEAKLSTPRRQPSPFRSVTRSVTVATYYRQEWKHARSQWTSDAWRETPYFLNETRKNAVSGRLAAGRSLTGCVENIHSNGLIIDGELSIVKIFDCFFVGVEKFPIEKHVNNRGFSRSTGAEKDKTIACVLICHIACFATIHQCCGRIPTLKRNALSSLSPSRQN